MITSRARGGAIRRRPRRPCRASHEWLRHASQAADWTGVMVSLVSGTRHPIPDEPFHLIEASIDDIHTAMLAGRLSCRRLAALYLDRIAAYDRQGPALHAVQSLNPHALAE